MKKSLLCLVACILASFSLNAAPVGRQQAQNIARKFLSERGVAVGQLTSTATGMAKAKGDGTPSYYVFNNGQNNGFVIVSGDDCAPLVLGYSDSGSFGEKNVPENLSSWLDGYAEQIEALKSGSAQLARANQAAGQQARISISPLVMTHWNQYAPYFDETPVKDGKQCLTGCVATAFAQVMKYHEWPKSATTVVPGYSWNGTTLSDLPATTFDWDNMLYDYQGGGNASTPCNDPDANKSAVAKLMKYCGYAVQADFNTGSTSASSYNIVNALTEYFGYKGDIQYTSRTGYSSADWDNLIYNELYAGRPVIYSGRNSSSGHAFICDGYGEDSYFHINWGWGGMSDGYYLLSILEPGKQGAGGSNSGYNQGQAIVYGIQPGAPSADDVTEGPCLAIMEFSLDESNHENVKVIHRVQGLLDGKHDLNAQLLQNGMVKYEGKPIEMNLNTGYFYPSSFQTQFFENLTLADGTYEVRLVCRMVEEGKEFEWIPCEGSDKYNNQVTISGNTVTCTNNTLSPNVVCNGFTPQPKMYVGNGTSAVASLSNEGGFYYQNWIYLWVNGTRVASDMAYIDAGKSFDMTFSFTPPATGTLPVKITTDGSGENVIYTGEINVLPVDENATYQLVMTAWSIENLDTDSKKICGGAVTGTITVTNIGNKTFEGPIGRGHRTGNGGGSMSYGSYTLAPGESIELDYTVEIAIVGNSYRLVCWENADFNKEIGTTELYELVAGGYTYWTADGTSKSKAETSATDVTVVDNAVAVKFFSTPENITSNDNPNTLFYLSGSTVPTSLSGKNVILNGKADDVKFADGYCFYVPQGFTATKATYSRVPKLGANGSSGWETIVLPFAATEAWNQTDNKQISWFLNREDDNKDFWLKSFAYTDGETAYFDFVDEIRANVPYIIATPGNKWGEQYNLLGKTIAFVGNDVTIPQTSKIKAMTDAFDFVGVSEQQTVSGYVLDAAGKYFERQSDATLDAYRAYFSVKADSPVAHSPKLKIGTYIPDGIKEVENLSDGEAVVYTLSGMNVGSVKVCNGRVDISHLPNGVYIINGKKLMK